MGRKSKFGCGFLQLPSERGSNKRPSECGQAAVISLRSETYDFTDGSGQHVVDWWSDGQGLLEGIVCHEEHRGW